MSHDVTVTLDAERWRAVVVALDARASHLTAAGLPKAAGLVAALCDRINEQLDRPVPVPVDTPARLAPYTGVVLAPVLGVATDGPVVARLHAAEMPGGVA